MKKLYGYFLVLLGWVALAIAMDVLVTYLPKVKP